MFISAKYIDLSRSENTLEGIFKVTSFRYATKVGMAELVSGNLKIMFPCDYDEYERNLLARFRQAIVNNVRLVVIDGQAFLCNSEDTCNPDECKICGEIMDYIKEHENECSKTYEVLW